MSEGRADDPTMVLGMTSLMVWSLLGRRFVCLGSVVLVITGAEALFADLGLFGA